MFDGILEAIANLIIKNAADLFTSLSTGIVTGLSSGLSSVLDTGLDSVGDFIAGSAEAAADDA